MTQGALFPLDERPTFDLYEPPWVMPPVGFVRPVGGDIDETMDRDLLSDGGQPVYGGRSFGQYDPHMRAPKGFAPSIEAIIARHPDRGTREANRLRDQYQAERRLRFMTESIIDWCMACGADLPRMVLTEPGVYLCEECFEDAPLST